jgi:hypothetical protein
MNSVVSSHLSCSSRDQIWAGVPKQARNSRLCPSAVLLSAPKSIRMPSMTAAARLSAAAWMASSTARAASPWPSRMMTGDVQDRLHGEPDRPAAGERHLRDLAGATPCADIRTICAA